MATILRGKLVTISAILLCVMYLGYRIYESQKRRRAAAPAHARRGRPHCGRHHSKAGGTDRDDYAPRQCSGLVSGTDLRPGLGLCEDVVQGLRRAGKEGRYPRRNQRAGARRPI